MVQLGVRLRTFEQNGQVVVQAYIPSQPRPIVLTARVALPSDVVGGKLGRKIKAKVKKVAKKLAKSKVLGKIAKVVKTVSKFVPGGQAISMSANAISLAKKLAKVAKHGSPKQKLVAKAIAQTAKRNIQRARGNAAPVPQGYPSPMASSLPDGRTSSPEALEFNGLPDSDPEEFSESIDPDQGAPSGEVEMDVDEEIGPDDDTSEEDETE